jgi:hypothetical protein
LSSGYFHKKLSAKLTKVEIAVLSRRPDIWAAEQPYHF